MFGPCAKNEPLVAKLIGGGAAKPKNEVGVAEDDDDGGGTRAADDAYDAGSFAGTRSGISGSQYDIKSHSASTSP